jgi:hypothetical protein
MCPAARYFREYQVAVCERFSELLFCACCLNERNYLKNVNKFSSGLSIYNKVNLIPSNVTGSSLAQFAGVLTYCIGEQELVLCQC